MSNVERAAPPLRIGIAAPGQRYVFNAAGQEIDVTGLLCLHDAHGPCANAVKDSMRTKTTDATTRVLCLVWGSTDLADLTERATQWYREILERTGARVEEPSRA